jgi:hypothetical protein
MKAKQRLIKMEWIARTQFGFDFIKFFSSILRVPIYIKDLIKFRKRYKGELRIVPSLHDRYSSNGDYEHEYFWQDLFMAQKIFFDKPKTHLDIGSRIDGFIANIASFREVQVLDIREQTTKIPNVIFKQADLMDSSSLKNHTGQYESISCLHTIEHFGLGRYGDPIMVDGFDVGFENICSMLSDDGTLYLSTPISNRSYVEFNSDRVTDYKKVLEIAEKLGLIIVEFRTITKDGVSESYSNDFETLMSSAGDYILGLFIFKKC